MRKMKKSQILNIISIVIAGIVLLNELQWIGKTDLAIMIIGLAIAVILNSVAQLLDRNKQE